MDIATRLTDLLDQRRLTRIDVAELTGLSDETVSRIVSGETKNPGVVTLQRIATALGITVGWILGERGFEFSADDRTELRRLVEWGQGILKATAIENSDLQRPNVSAMVVGRKPAVRSPRRDRATPVSATNWRDSFGDLREARELDIPQQFEAAGATLMFRADGESMVGEHIAHGDLLYVREEPDPRHARGRIVVCVVSGSPYVKRLEFADRKIRLVSANEPFTPMVFDEDNVDWSLVGVVVGWSHDAR